MPPKFNANSVKRNNNNNNESKIVKKALKQARKKQRKNSQYVYKTPDGKVYANIEAATQQLYADFLSTVSNCSEVTAPTVIKVKGGYLVVMSWYPVYGDEEEEWKTKTVFVDMFKPIERANVPYVKVYSSKKRINRYVDKVSDPCSWCDGADCEDCIYR